VFLLPLAARGGAQETGTVEEVVDGDTLRVRIAGTTSTVRLIGLDAPERSHPSKSKEFLADEAAGFLSSLCAGKTVRLEPGSEESDGYGRLLRYVFLPPPDGRLLNEEMVRQGYARVLRRYPFSREAAFAAAEEQARREGKGIWREGGMAEVRWALRQEAAATVHPLAGGRYAIACRGMVKANVLKEDLGRTLANVIRMGAENSQADFERKAADSGFVRLHEDPAVSRAAPVPKEPPGKPSSPLNIGWQEAHLHVGKEVVVEGKIVRTHRGKRVLHLNFHPNWKKYVTVVVLGRDLGRFPADAERHFEGKTVRVRGTVSLYKERPEIVVRSPDAIAIVK
jgi:micrococcal nuclease